MLTHYYQPEDAGSHLRFAAQLDHYLKNCDYRQREIIFLCIGSDRATGDSLGPILGYKLNLCRLPHFKVYGTLTSPVHALNLEETLEEISLFYPGHLLIAVDASLGTKKHIGRVTLSDHGIYPGLGVKKELPATGEISITGIVNSHGNHFHKRLQTTSLNTVMKLSDYILAGILNSSLGKSPQSDFHFFKYKSFFTGNNENRTIVSNQGGINYEQRTKKTFF